MFQKLKIYFKNFLVISYEFVMGLIMSLPRYSLFLYIKKLFLNSVGAKVGKGVVIYPGVWISPGRNLVIGDDVDLSRNVLITSSGGVEIGDRALIGYGTQILSSNHTIPIIGEKFPISGDDHKKVLIEKDTWIGANCIILPGITIEQGAVVAAGSIVTKNVKANAIVAGNPAKLIRYRD